MAALNFEDVKISCADGMKIAAAILEKAGMEEGAALEVADNLVYADKRGVTTHGLSRMKMYTDRIKNGNNNVAPKIEIIKEAPSSILVDGDHGFGAVVGTYTMNKVIEKARQSGIAFGIARNSTHYGAAAYYTTMAVKHGMIGFSCTNGVPNMAPFGSYSPLLGTNPFSLAAPSKSYSPMVLDIATSAVARGNILNASREGVAIPQGWALDAEGRPTTDADAALKGCVLPFGGHKGSGIAIFIDILSGMLGGDVFGIDVRTDKKSEELGIAGPGVSHAFAAINISAFQDVEEFKQKMDKEIESLKSARKAQGVKEIFYPGEIEDRKEKASEAEGIWLAKGTFKNLCALSEEYDTGIRPEECVLNK